MATWYIDPVNGVDAAAGSSWATAWKTPLTGATAARLTAGDTIRIAKTADAVDTTLQGTWVSGSYGAQSYSPTNGAVSIGGSITYGTNPCTIQTTAVHGLVTGDMVLTVGTPSSELNASPWQVTVTDTTHFTVPVSATGSGASGSVYKISNQVVTLSATVSRFVHDCQTIWTAGTTCTVTKDAASLKTSLGYAKFVTASPATNTKLGYVLTPFADYSGYQQVSFWIRTNISITAGQYTLKMCSDTAGNTPYLTLAIPAIVSASQWVVITLDNGSALPSGIQSLALYTDATTAPTNSIFLDHIIACLAPSNASAITLSSLIGKNNGTGWFCVRAINGTKLYLDHGVNSAPSTSRGYYGVSETVGLWRRETYKVPMASSLTPIGNTTNGYLAKSGTAGNQITYSGGWNTASNLLDGETHWDGQNGWGFGMCSFNNVQNLTITGMNFSRFSVALSTGLSTTTYQGTLITASNITNCGAALLTGAGTTGGPSTWTINNISFMSGDCINLNACNSLTLNVTNLFAVIGNGITTANNFSPVNNTVTVGTIASLSGVGVVMTPNSKLTATAITTCLSGAITVPYGTVFQSSSIAVGSITGTGATVGINVVAQNTIISNTTISGFNPAVYPNGTAACIVRNCTLTGNTTDVTVSSNIGVNYVLDSTLSTYSVSGSVDERLYVRNPNGTTAALCYSDNMTCQTDLATVHTAGNRSWKIATSRTSAGYPATLNLGYVTLGGNVINTISAWVRYDTAGMLAGIQVVGNQIEGMTVTQLATSTGTINTWIQVTLTITAATQSGPVMLQAYGLSSSGTQNMWIADISVT